MSECKNSSWEPVSEWYDKIVGKKGHYYHENLILPKLLNLFSFNRNGKESLLDLGCGQGILAKHLPKEVDYVGIDSSASLIRKAKEAGKKTDRFFTADLTRPLNLEKKDFTHAALVLSLQNMEDPLAVLKNTSAHLQKGGQLFIVLNHPSFRIPRQTSWLVDKVQKIQYRRVDRYCSFLKIPIQMNPSQQAASSDTWSFHFPLSAYSAWLKEAGFMIELIEEWCSDKTSEGGAAVMENRARLEFPLFMTIQAIKK